MKIFIQGVHQIVDVGCNPRQMRVSARQEFRLDLWRRLFCVRMFANEGKTLEGQALTISEINRRVTCPSICCGFVPAARLPALLHC